MIIEGASHSPEPYSPPPSVGEGTAGKSEDGLEEEGLAQSTHFFDEFFPAETIGDGLPEGFGLGRGKSNGTAPNF